jgi:hypothetical protein
MARSEEHALKFSGHIQQAKVEHQEANLLRERGQGASHRSGRVVPPILARARRVLT